MEIAIKLSQFLLSLSILMILHELGHFIPAKLFKTRVEKFYLFFDIKYSTPFYDKPTLINILNNATRINELIKIINKMYSSVFTNFNNMI
jgi:hypothetical protein